MGKFFSRKERLEAERKQKCKDGLIILRYATDLFRIVDTVYRIFRMML